MNAAPDLPVEQLRKYLTYDPDTGFLTWLERAVRLGLDRTDKGWNTRLAGTRAGRIGTGGAIYVGISYRRLYESRNFAAHRVAWALHYGEWPTEDIDHINGDPTDNRIVNLRLATDSQNLRNARRRSDNTSGVRGVSWSKKSRKWYAYINVGGRMIALGKFTDKAKAVAVRRAAALHHFGEYALEVRTGPEEGATEAT